MKKNILITLIMLSTFQLVKSQAHLGYTENAIMKLYPEKKWIAKYLDNGVKYIQTEMDFGYFTYYFDKETNLSVNCMQIPFNLISMNGQVEIYNKKYVITSDKSWTAYLDEGKIIYIKLIYLKKNKISLFSYNSTKEN